MNLIKNNIWKLIKKYKFKSVFFEYCKYLFLLVIIPAVIFSIVFFNTARKSSNTEAVSQLKNKMYQYRTDFTQLFDSNYNFYLQTLNNNYVKLALLKIPDDGIDAQRYAEEIKELMNNYISQSNVLDSIGIYSDKTEFLYSSAGSNYLKNCLNTYWYNLYISSGKQGYIAKAPNNNVIFTYNINASKNTTGLIILTVNKQKLELLFSDHSTPNSEIILLRNDSTGEILFSNTSADIPIEALIAHANDYYALSADNYNTYKNFITVSSPISDYDCTLYTVADTNLYGFNKTTHSIFVFFILIIILLLVLLIFFISIKFYGSVADIVANIELPLEDIPTENNSSYNELRYINRNMLELISKNKKVEIELVNKMEKLKKAQSIALQTQINPHFVFNTLNLINSIILERTNEDVEEVKLICTLCELLQNSLNTTQYLIPFEQEIDYVKKYLQIELTKYCNIFEVTYDIEPECNNCLTVKMILQPIVENAVCHGVIRLSDNKKGMIKISAYKEDKSLYIKISDNGPGIVSEKLAELNNKLRMGEIPENHHVGLCNVSNRINLIHGDCGELTVHSSENGTTIIIKQPFNTDIF